MTFNSLAFLVFIGGFAAAWPLVRGRSALRMLAICGFSLFFYGWWDWRYVPLLLGVAIVTYGAAAAMLARPSLRTVGLAAGVAGPLLVLAVYKYSGFFARIPPSRPCCSAAGPMRPKRCPASSRSR